MKKILISLFALILFTQISYSQSSTTEFSCVNNENLLTLAGWALYTDKYGSTIDAEAFFKDTSFITIKYVVAKIPSENEYPWIEADCYLPDFSSLETLRGVMLNYRSTKGIKLILSQPPLINYGECYQKILPASATWKSVNIPIKDFEQPEWSTHKDIPVKVSDIISVAIAPDVENDSTAISGIIEIKELKLCGPKINLSNTDIVVKSFSLTTEHLHLLLSKTDKYNISIISPKTGLVYSSSNNPLNAGFNKIELPKPVEEGEYIIDISTTNTTFIKKTKVLSHHLRGKR